MDNRGYVSLFKSMNFRLFLLGAALPLAPAMADPGDLAPAQPVIPARVFRLADFHAVPDGRTSDTEAFRRALAAVAAAGGGTLVVERGQYLLGPITLVSRCDLHLEAGARLLFSQNFDDYPKESGKRAPLIGASGCHDLMISGEGVIDGRGDPWWVIERKAKREARARGLHDAEIGRPRMVVFTRCQRVRLEGVTLANSPMYHFVPTQCEDVTVEGVRILSPADSPNTDGIDPSVSRRVLIAHCRIDTGDDCIAVKAGPKGGPVEDVLVTDCAFLHGHGCSIGSETNSGVRRMTVRRCTFDGTDIGVRLKSARDRGGLVEDVTYRDLTMRHVGEAIVISSYYYDLPKFGQRDQARPVTASTPQWRRLTIRNVVATEGTDSAGLIIGLPEAPATSITLENVRIEAPRGLRIGYARDVTLRDVAIAARGGPAILTDETVQELVR